MKIKRIPKPWASQKIFFDVICFNGEGFETNRRAMFLCKGCRHVCEWNKESDAFRCTRCGKKLTSFGANEIIMRYEKQLHNLKRRLTRKGK